MAPQSVERKLTAILSADVKGYSRLMGEDEVATVRTLTAYREVMASRIQQHRGRVVDSPGDNLLAEFASVVDAVQCAVEIQRELKARNAELPDHRKMEFRIGINLGDVIVEGERIYGDGVNIAARVEGLAEGGGICLSGTAYDQVKNKLALAYESLGEHAVKNIAEPVRVYRAEMEPKAAAPTSPAARGVRHKATAAGVALLIVAVAAVLWNFYLRPAPPPAQVAAEKTTAVSLPEKPSVAVLPFDNLSGDPEQEYFSDGITEDIITALSKVSDLLVIARNSTFTYKGKPVKVQQVGEELGARYVLEGSVRKAADKVRITAQLVDATTGHHLWAERFDRELKDVFALQDEITQRIVEGLEVKLTQGEQARLYRRATDNPAAYEKWLQGMQHFHLFSEGGNIRARQLWREALEMDPDYGAAYVMLAYADLMEVWFGWSESPLRSMKEAVELAQRALALDDTSANTYALLGHIHLLKKEHDRAISLGERAVALSPSAADVTALLAITLSYAEREEEAIRLFDRAMRLNPLPPNWYLQGLGWTYVRAERYEDAILMFQKVLQRNPDFLLGHAGLATTYSLLGREGEARVEAAEVRRLNPNFSLAYWAETQPHKNRAELELVLDAQRKAGLPE